MPSSKPAGIAEYNTIITELGKAVTAFVETNDHSSLLTLVDSCSSNPKNYYFGLGIINTFVNTLSQPANLDETRNNFRAALTSAHQAIADPESMSSRLCLFALRVIDLPASSHSVQLLGSQDEEIETNFRKIICHMALLVLSFQNGQLKYTGKEWKAWDKHITQENFYFKVCLDGKHKSSIYSLLTVIEERLNQDVHGLLHVQDVQLCLRLQ